MRRFFCGFHEPIFGTIITISEICRNYNWSAHFVWNVISFASLVELYFRHSIQSFNHTFFWIGWSLCVCRTYGFRFRIECVYLNKVGFCVQLWKKTKEKQNNCILNGNWNWAFVLSFGFYSAQITPSNNKHWMVMNWNGSDWFGLVRIGWDCIEILTQVVPSVNALLFINYISFDFPFGLNGKVWNRSDKQDTWALVGSRLIVAMSTGAL